MKNNCWDRLLQLAEAHEGKVRREMVKAREQVNVTKQRLHHLQDIRMEYQDRLKEMEGTNHSIDNNLLYRKFINQVTGLEERLLRDLNASKAWVTNAKTKYIRAQKETSKYDFLLSQREKKLKNLLAKKEANEMDSIAILLHNYR